MGRPYCWTRMGPQRARPRARPSVGFGFHVGRTTDGMKEHPSVRPSVRPSRKPPQLLSSLPPVLRRAAAVTRAPFAKWPQRERETAGAQVGHNGDYATNILGPKRTEVKTGIVEPLRKGCEANSTSTSRPWPWA